MGPAPARPPITDSFWFWACLFATMGLVALWAVSLKYEARQDQIERNATGRVRAAEHMAGEEMTTEVPREGERLIALRPLFFILAALLAVGWVVLWWQHFRPHEMPEHKREPKVRLR